MNRRRLATRDVSGEHPLAARYVTQLQNELSAVGAPADEIAEIGADIRNHFAEAQLSGQSMSVVMEGQGAVEDLARAYQMALALGVRFEDPRSSWFAQLRRAGILVAVAAQGLLMGVLGLTMVLAGVLGVLAAVVLPFVSSGFLDPTLRLGAPQLVVFLLSALLLAVGCLSLRLVTLASRSLMVTKRRVQGPDPTMTESSQARTASTVRSFEVSSESTPESSSGITTVARPEVETWKRNDS